MKSSAFQPLILIVLGLLWFLKSSALLPDTTTLLALLLAASGVVLLVVDGLTKSTVVTAPMLMYAGVAVYLFDEDKLRLSHMLSLGMILLGLLMLIARSERIPERRQRRVAGND
ncbi:hypothetical protein [Vogesella sp. XCS3]|uniref:hypothetical protein n=1 Tax=Vogesella sp. XCS3 TaxID=2877939 RepID=UPI001B5CF6A4|nr:hypothetical protein [Vogesella sp. XCS3]MBP7582380.1 hypothetical protein [Vogesella sp.]UDM18625.1 hypothetical protein LCH97_08230 [Vogesella sp. XCS3]